MFTLRRRGLSDREVTNEYAELSFQNLELGPSKFHAAVVAPVLEAGVYREIPPSHLTGELLHKI
jgi:hypothetical protein